MSMQEGALKPWLLTLVVRDKGKGRSRNSRIAPVSNDKTIIGDSSFLF